MIWHQHNLTEKHPSIKMSDDQAGLGGGLVAKRA